MKVIADRVGAGETPKAVAQDLLKKHMKCVFNGDGYDPKWPEEAVKKGIWRIDRGVDAICEMTSDKNLEFFGSMGVLSAEEAKARQDVLLEHYVGVVDMEAKCLKDMITQHLAVPRGEEDGWQEGRRRREAAREAHQGAREGGRGRHCEGCEDGVRVALWRSRFGARSLRRL